MMIFIDDIYIFIFLTKFVHKDIFLFIKFSYNVLNINNYNHSVFICFLTVS